MVRGNEKGLLGQMYREWPFFRTLLSNMDMVFAKTDLSLARRCGELAHDRDTAVRIFATVEAEVHRTADVLNEIMGT